MRHLCDHVQYPIQMTSANILASPRVLAMPYLCYENILSTYEHTLSEDCRVEESERLREEE